MRWCVACVVSMFLVCCTPKDQTPAIIIWEHGRAVGVSLLTNDSVYVDGSSYAMLGNTEDMDGRVVFTPAAAFQRGQMYRTSSGITFTIPADTTQRAPRLAGSFPSCDTVPSNLLKMYLQFSEPMSEGRAYQYVQLFDAMTGDTIKNAFLDLQPELWNEDGTVLTLWLDPGRIKQDLIPNKKLGVVLNDNHRYRLTVAKGWKARNGVALEDDYTRTFVTSTRDVRKPDVKNWKIKITGDTVAIYLNESLDWSLLNSTVSILHNDSKTISGAGETTIYLLPFKKLSRGEYTLQVESRLEDLAGNNLNRLFETDVTAASKDSQKNHIKKSPARDLHTIQFHVN